MQIASNSGDLRGMKRNVSVAFCIIVLCSMILLANTGAVKAYQTGYQADDYTLENSVTVDGTWTTNTEWDDAAHYPLGGGLNGIFRLKYDAADDLSYVNQYWLIELFSDNTNDAEDYWQICYAAAASFGGVPVGGTTPQTDCWRFDYKGHAGASSATIYRGDGSGWVPYTSWTWNTDFQVADTISASKLNSTPHWIAEIKVEHIHFTFWPEMWIRIAAYDASNGAAGVQACPPASSRDAPNDWALLNSVQEAIPETLTIGVMVLLSSVAVIVGSRYFRKRSRIESYGSGKLTK